MRQESEDLCLSKSVFYCNLEAKASLQVVHVLMDFTVEVPSVCLEPYRPWVSPSVYSHVGEYWVL